VVNVTTQSNVGVLGNNSTTTIYAKVALTVTSDERDKSAFQTIPWTLDMLPKVKIGMFQFRDRQSGALETKMRYGFSAQNIMELEQLVLNRNVLVDCSDPDHLKLNESMMVPILFKMVQELHARVQVLEAQKGQ
jgi:hypothetical protein